MNEVTSLATICLKLGYEQKVEFSKFLSYESDPDKSSFCK